jgi:hypothetical protein
MEQKEQLIKFILNKIEKETTNEKPYFILRWSGLYELTRSMGYDLLSLIDEMHNRGLIKKALIPTKKGKKLLAVALPSRILSDKSKKIFKEFQEFLKNS